MSARQFRNWKTVAANLRALAIGVMVATALVTVYTLIEALAAERAVGGSTLLDWQSQALFALLYSPVVAVFLAAICAPLWLLLGQWDLDRWYAAAALGFLAVMAYWIVNDSETARVPESIRSGLGYGLCGAAAGLASWHARPRP